MGDRKFDYKLFISALHNYLLQINLSRNLNFLSFRDESYMRFLLSAGVAGAMSEAHIFHPF